jgi:hypothetical protein
MAGDEHGADREHRAGSGIREYRLFPLFSPEQVIRDVDVGHDDREGQLTAARQSAAHRRGRNAVRVLLVVAAGTGAVLVWELVSHRFWVSPWIPAGVLIPSLLLIGVLGVRGRRLRKAVQRADARIGIPIPADHHDEIFDGAITLQALFDKLGLDRLPVSEVVDLGLSDVDLNKVSYLNKFVADARRVREAWATGDEQRWLRRSARFADLCGEIDNYGDLVIARMRANRPRDSG